jgi:hypothetical protein
MSERLRARWPCMCMSAFLGAAMLSGHPEMETVAAFAAFGKQGRASAPGAS